MPIQYPDAPQFQAPNLNLLGAYAQGAALQQQQLQEDRLRQQMDLAERAAGYTANRETREASKAEMEERVKLQELKAKVLEHAKAQLQNIPEGDNTAYQAVIGQYKDMLPEEYAIASKMKWDADTRKRFLLTPEQQYAQAKPEYMEAGGEVYRKTAGGLVPAQILPSEGMPGERLNMPAAKAAVSNIESGGNYQAVGPVTKSGDRAYGKYQVMGANIPKWTKEVLGKSLTPQEFLLDKDAQEAVFEDQFRRNTEKYGSAQDAASVWFSGKPLAKAGQRADILGTTVPSYVNKFNAVYGRQAPVSNVMAAPITGAAPQMPVGPIAPPAGMLMPQQPVSQAMPTPAPQPITVGTKKQVVGQTNVEKTLGRMINLYDTLDEMKEIPSEKRGPLENIGAYARGTTLGQEVEKARATPAQTKRNEIRSLQRALLNDIKNSTGMSAQEINSNFELKNMLETLSDPTQSIESVKAILADISARYGQGKIALPAEAAAPAEAPASRPPLSSFFKR